MAIRNTFVAAGSKDVDSLRRSVNNGFQSIVDQSNREAISEFTELSDTPGSLGTPGQFVLVNATGDSLEFGSSPSELEDRETPTSSLTIPLSELETLNATTSIIDRNITLDNDTSVGLVDVVATPLPDPTMFRYTVTIDVTSVEWIPTSITIGPTSLSFNLVVGEEHEWSTTFTTAQLTGDLVINVNDVVVETGIFYTNSAGDEFRLDNVHLTTGSIEDLGFQTEIDAAATFQEQSPNDPYVVMSDLASYLTEEELPVTVTRDDTFPTAPVDGDVTYLTTNLYPTGTTFTTSPVSVDSSGAGNQAFIQITATDPVTTETIVAGTVFVNQQNVPVDTSARITIQGGAGRTFTRGFTRDRGFQGLHATRSSTVGTTIITTTVSEVRYAGVTTTPSGGGTTLTLDNAFLHDYHYQQVTRNRAGSAIIRNLHYFVIRTPTGDINTYLTQENVIPAIEAVIQDGSNLQIGLVQGAHTPVTFTSTAQFPTGSYDVTGDLGARQEETTYRFLPLNGFSIDQANTNIEDQTTITRVITDGVVNESPVSIFGTDGSVNLIVNDEVEDWDVRFTRTFTGVPVPAGTTTTATTGPYIFQDGDWNKLQYDGNFITARSEDLSLFVSSQTVAAGFGTLNPNSGTHTWTHTVQVNGVTALTINASAVTHAADADYIFNYTVSGGWTLLSGAQETTSRPLTYSGRDLIIRVRNTNPVYATNARIEIFKEMVAASTSFSDFQSKIVNL